MELSSVFRTSEWILISVFLLALLVAVGLGNALGRRYQKSTTDSARTYASGILAGTIGLLGLILGFSFSMALSRYEAAKSQMVSEANAIGTAYLRSQALGPNDARIAKGLFSDYATALDEYYKLGLNSQAAEATGQKLSQLSSKLWSELIVISRTNHDMVPTGLYMQALNEMIDQSSLRLNLIQFHIPEPIYALLLIISVLTLGLAGYVAGLGSLQRSASSTILAIMVALVFLVIIDLERPKRGFIRVENTRIEELQKSVQGKLEPN